MIYIFQIGDINIRRLINQTQSERLVSYNYSIEEFIEPSPYVQGDSQSRDTIYAALTYTIQGKTDLQTLEKLSYLTSSKEKNLIPIFGLKVLDDSLDISDNSNKQKYQIVYNVGRIVKTDQNNEPSVENLFNEKKNRDEYSVRIEVKCKTTSFHNIEENLEIIESRSLALGGAFVPFDFNIDRTHFVNRESLNENKDYYICKAESRLFGTSTEALNIQQLFDNASQNNYIFGSFAKGAISPVSFLSLENKFFTAPNPPRFAPFNNSYDIYADIENTGTKRADKAIFKLNSQERYNLVPNVNTDITTGVFDRPNQFFQIYNESTKTGFKITWNNDYKSPILFYRTHTAELFVQKTNFVSGFEPDGDIIIQNGQISFPSNETIYRVFIRNYRQLLMAVPYTLGVQNTLTNTQYSWDQANNIIYFNPTNNNLNVTIEKDNSSEIISGDYLTFNGSVKIENISDFNNGIFELSGLDNSLDTLTVQLFTNIGVIGQPNNSVPGLITKRQQFNVYCPVQYIQN